METTEKKRKERKSTASIRKASRHGEHTQKMMSFRIDEVNAEKLAREPNKGRLINNLLAEHYRQQDSNGETPR